MKRNKTENSHLRLLKASAITNEKDLAFLHFGPVRAGLISTPRPRTETESRLAQLSALLNDLESGLKVLQYKLQEVSSTYNIDLYTEEVLAVRLPSTIDITGIEEESDE